MTHKRFLSLVAAGAVALAASVSAASAQDKVKVGVFPISSSLPYFVAIEKGYFKENNIEPETIRLMGGPPNVAALMTNQIDVSAVLVTLEGLERQRQEAGCRDLYRHAQPELRSTRWSSSWFAPRCSTRSSR